MRIRELLSTGRPSFSFEFFPPKDAEGFARLREALASLRELRPTYVSVTYGAAGETRRWTIELVTSLRAVYGLEAMAHVTCVDASRAEILTVLERLRMALRDVALKGRTYRCYECGYTSLSLQWQCPGCRA
jgi:methylenetetrahydrofolate reductase (NADPH)